MESCNSIENTDASVIRGSGSFNEDAQANGIYVATCYDSEGALKWTEEFENVVVVQGKNYLLDQGFAASVLGHRWCHFCTAPQ